jgi:hypothetical protein
MLHQLLVCLLLTSLVFGQAAPVATTPATPPATGATAEQAAPAAPVAPEVKVGPDETVITLKGFCTDKTLQGDACKTSITRTQFEKVIDAVQPGMPPAMRRQAATSYSRMVRMSTAAESRGLDKGTLFDEKMVIARMQILSQLLSRSLQEESAKVSDSDIEDYYKKNAANYEQATFERIYVPHTKQIVIPAAKPAPKTAAGAKAGAAAKPTVPKQPTEAQKKAAEDAMKKLADTLHTRAVNGEDPEKLQKEAHVAAGLPGNPPIAKMEKVRKNTLPPTHAAVMDLKPGEVSEVIADPNGAYYIYKMISEEELPLDSVKAEIRSVVSSERLRDSMQGFQGTTNIELNDAYFGPMTKGPMMPPAPRVVRPPSPPAQNPD